MIFHPPILSHSQLESKQAKALAAAVVSQHPQAPVLVLAQPNWHHGVAGPAASQIAETFQRSAILLAPNGDRWKGSGRSTSGDHLGCWIRTIKSLGLVERGGGHSAAVGLAATNAQIAALQTAGMFLPMPQTDHEPESEIIGDLVQLSAEAWVTLIELLSPFGRKNPLPLLHARGAVCLNEPVALVSQEDQKIWALKAKFKILNGKVITVLWRDAEAARAEWTVGVRYDLTLELTVQRKAEKIFHNWSASSCRRSGNDRKNAVALAAPGETSFAFPRQAIG